MEVAKSIYLGGEIIPAHQCNHLSYKELGLVCPFCHEALHLRMGYKRGGTYIKPHYAHFKSKGSECEARITTKAGRDYIRKQIIIKQNQRLELFRQRLWDIFLDNSLLRVLIRDFKTLSTSHKALKKAKKDKRVDYFTDCFLSNIVRPILMLGEVEIIDLFNNAKRELRQELKNKKYTDEMRIIVNNNLEYFENGGKLFMHIKIIKEIMEFLPSKSGRYCLKLFVINCLAIIESSEMPDKTTDRIERNINSIILNIILTTGYHNAIKN